VVPIQHRPFRGSDDPGLPAGIWIVQSSVLGDAGGGVLTLDILFKDGSLPVPESSFLYSLEQLSLFTSANLQQRGSMNPSNWDEITPGATGTTATIFRLTLNEMDGVNGAAWGGEMAGRPGYIGWFLGQVRKNTTNTIVRFQVDNVVANSLGVKAEGYYWGPRSVNAEGGPRRPVGSLYG